METQNNPLISVITVCLNSEKTIERTILSVINQTYKNIEYIIIDGGSTDSTLQIIEKYKDKISHLTSEKDNGISDAFNKGIKASHGLIIGIINSDDWYENETLAKIANLYNKERADLYIGSMRYWLPDGKNTIMAPEKTYRKRINYYMPHLPHPSTFVTKKTYEDIGIFDTKYKYAMDYDFFLRAHRNKKIFYLTSDIFTNMQAGGASYVYKKQAYQEVLKISSNKFLGGIYYLLFMLRYCIWKKIKNEKIKSSLYIIFYKIKKILKIN